MDRNAKILAGLALCAFPALFPCRAQEAWDLERCIEHAVSHNLAVKQQEAARDRSEIELNTARWSRLPDLNGTASHSFNFGRSLQADNTYRRINTQSTGFGLSTSIPLFTGMQIPNTVALSELNLQAAVEDLNKAKEDVSLQVVSAYLQVLFNQELAKVAHEQVALSKEMLAQKAAFFENGKALKDYNKDFYTDGGEVCSPVDYTPPSNQMNVTVNIFIPYSELHLASGRHDLKTFVVVWDDHKRELARSDWLHFWVNQV